MMRLIARKRVQEAVTVVLRRALIWAGNGLLRLAGSEDVPQVKARLEGALSEERTKLISLEARYTELSGFYWDRIRDGAGWRAHLHRKIAKLEAQLSGIALR